MLGVRPINSNLTIPLPPCAPHETTLHNVPIDSAGFGRHGHDAQAGAAKYRPRPVNKASYPPDVATPGPSRIDAKRPRTFAPD